MDIVQIYHSYQYQILHTTKIYPCNNVILNAMLPESHLIHQKLPSKYVQYRLVPLSDCMEVFVKFLWCLHIYIFGRDVS